jgi:cellulose synthase/poly-beta-1,6-N-acetylglucosamine synthase-like glycosyltransferase
VFWSEVFWFWFFVGPAILLAILALRGERKRAEFVLSCLAETNDSFLPAVTLIVPVKGPDEGLKENLASLAALDYPDYELIVCAQTAGDIPSDVAPSGATLVFSQNGSPDTSEKIQNLLTAIRVSRKRSEVFAFADCDGRVSKTWLRALVKPLAEPGAGASTAYRWHLPEPPTFWSLMRSVWNAPIAGMFGPGSNPFAWGGAMAISKSTFYEARVPDFWQASISDDFGLTAAVRSIGLSIAFAPGAMVASTDHINCKEFFAWIRRQMIVTRVYCGNLWWPALIAHIFYCGGMAAALIASARGHRGAEWALVVQLGLGMLKGANRATLAKAELPQYETWFKRYGWVHTMWVPLATWIWLWALIFSTFTNRIQWRGRRYLLRRPVAPKV